MFINQTDIEKRLIQTTVNFPLFLYVELVSRAKKEEVSLSEVVRRVLLKELERSSVGVQDEE